MGAGDEDRSGEGVVTDAKLILHVAGLIEKYCVGMPESTPITIEDRIVNIDFTGFPEHEQRARESADAVQLSGRTVSHFRHKERIKDAS